jgi:hypothetical protein
MWLLEESLIGMAFPWKRYYRERFQRTGFIGSGQDLSVHFFSWPNVNKTALPGTLHM